MDLPRLIAAAVLLAFMFAGCSSRLEDSPAYKAACHGAPLHRDIERRDQALQDGYEINRTFDCIDKASYLSINAQKARSAAANTPETIAQRREDHERRTAEEARTAAARAETADPAPASPPAPIVRRDVNTASESDLASVPSVGAAVAAQIVEQRDKRPFSNWADLINRVVGLGSAQSAVYASICGLTVNGESLPGAPADTLIAARLQARFDGPK